MRRITIVVDAEGDLQMNDLVSRQAVIDAIEECGEGYYMGTEMVLPDDFADVIKRLPSAQPTLYGYNIEHLELIARVLQEEDLPPERIVEVLTDIGRIVAIVKDEFEETLRKAVEQLSEPWGGEGCERRRG